MDIDKSVNFASLSPLSFLERNQWVYKNKEAIMYGPQKYTYREFSDRVQRCASALKNAGIKPGDRVAYLCPNIPPMLEAHFAVPLLGAILVAMNTRLSPDEITYICEHSGAKVLIADAELAIPLSTHKEKFSTIETFVNVIDEQAGFGEKDTIFEGPEYESFINSSENNQLPWKIEDELTPISINYTSGTTGKPKGVMYTHRGCLLYTSPSPRDRG